MEHRGKNPMLSKRARALDDEKDEEIKGSFDQPFEPEENEPQPKPSKDLNFKVDPASKDLLNMTDQINQIVEHDYDDEEDKEDKAVEIKKIQAGFDMEKVNDIGIEDQSSRKALKDPMKILMQNINISKAKKESLVKSEDTKKRKAK